MAIVSWITKHIAFFLTHPVCNSREGGEGELAYVVIRGCAIILGTFLGAPGFLGIIFLVKFDFFRNNPNF